MAQGCDIKKSINYLDGYSILEFKKLLEKVEEYCSL